MFWPVDSWLAAQRSQCCWNLSWRILVISNQQAFTSSSNVTLSNKLGSDLRIRFCWWVLSDIRPQQLHWPDCPELPQMADGQPYFWAEVAHQTYILKHYKTVVKYWTLVWIVNVITQIILPYLQWLSMEIVQISAITSPIKWRQCKTVASVLC